MRRSSSSGGLAETASEFHADANSQFPFVQSGVVTSACNGKLPFRHVMVSQRSDQTQEFKHAIIMDVVVTGGGEIGEDGITASEAP